MKYTPALHLDINLSKGTALLLFYPALVLFERANCIDIFVIYCHMLPVELWESSYRSSSLPVDRKISKGAIKG